MSLENNFKIEYSFAEDIISLEPEKYKPLVAKFILFIFCCFPFVRNNFSSLLPYFHFFPTTALNDFVIYLFNDGTNTITGL